MLDTLKIHRTWFAILLALLTGCATEYAWKYDPNTGEVSSAGTRQVFSPAKAQQVADGVAGVVDGLAGAAGTYARGYAQASQTYQAEHPITASHSGAIFGPNGQTSLYNINDDGYGAIYGPNGATLVSPHALYGPNGQTTIISGN
jgi:hypothetical protein